MNSKQKANREKHRQARKMLVAMYKREHGCIHCGMINPVCLEFHHRVPVIKADTVSNLLGQWSISEIRLFQEIEKCDVICANCHRALHIGIYEKAQSERYVTRRDWVNTYKEESGCCICGMTNPNCLDFHHRDPEQKSFGIPGYLTASLGRLIIEITKCDVICANCHRIHHYGEIA